MVGSEEVPKHLGLLYYQMRKMEMELTCPTCSNLLRMPTVLPCSHIFCSSCIMTRDENQYKCPACLLIFHRRELRHSEHFEEIVNIFKSMETTMTGIRNLDSQVGISGVNTPSKECLGLGCKHNDEMQGSRLDLSTVKVASNESHSCSGLSHAGAESQECQFGVLGMKVPPELTSVPSNCTKENLQEAVSCALPGGNPRYDDSKRSLLGGSQQDRVNETKLKREVEVMRLPRETWNVETQHSGITNNATNCMPSHPPEVDSVRGSKRFNLGSKLHSKPKNQPLDNSCESLGDKTVTKEKIKANTSSLTQIDAISMRQCIPEEQRSELTMTPLGVCSDWLLCGSDLSTSEEELLVKFASLTGASVVTGRWRNNTTHVIVSTYKHAACRRTMKVLKAIVNGKWVLSIEWVKACMKAGQPVPEERYEISQVGLETCTSFNGPKKGRLNATNKAPKIFHGIRFCFGEQFETLERGILEDLVLDAGGTVLRKDELTSHAELSSSGSSYIVVNENYSAEWSEFDRKKVLEKRSDEAIALKLMSGFQVIGNASILDIIAACNSADDLAKHVILV